MSRLLVQDGSGFPSLLLKKSVSREMLAQVLNKQRYSVHNFLSLHAVCSQVVSALLGELKTPPVWNLLQVLVERNDAV